MKSPSSFIAITSEGGLLPADFLHELPDPKTTIEGVTPVAYHLAEGERLNEQINRSWNRLKGCWENFKKAVAAKPASDPTTTDTRERWLFPLFQELGFGRLTAAKPIEVDGRSYPVSHGWNQVPIHLVGSHADLDHRTPGAIGAAKASPHSLVQSALNASDAHLWGIVSNGSNLRLLRDNIALTRLAFVEFDLQAMFDGDLYSEFFVLWLVCHQSRFEGGNLEEGASPMVAHRKVWLERWKKSAEDKTLRALDDLYPGVKKAIAALGSGLVSHPGNTALREKLRTGKLTTQEFYRQVLRVIYRMLFQLVAEDRALLHVPDESEAALKARRRYLDFYSIARLRSLTLYRSGTPHPDLWHVFQFVTGKLGSDTGCPELALPPLGSFLWSAAQSTPDLLDSLISNRHFLEAVHAIAFVQDGNVRRAVDYKNLGSEELGSVYQGLLEMHPRINADAGSFELDTAAGNERKTSGSYYTPDSLVQCLLDSALEPVIAERLAKAKTTKEKDAALLSLKVCDMAAGSGHFIIRAGHRIARHLARVRSGEEEPSPRVYQTALRDVIGHCLYGVDINPMSVELCKVTLWLEALEPGKPLSFLDHHIRCGNSLLGTTPDLIRGGIPEDAYTAIEGDDKEACAALKKKNKRENPKLGEWFVADEAVLRDKLYQAAAAIDEISDNRPEDIRRKEAAFQVAQSNYDFQKAKDLADLWCAAFVIKKYFPATTDQTADLQPPTSAAPVTPAETQSVMFGGADEAPKTKAKKNKAPSRADSEIPIGITTQHLRDFVAGGELPNGLLGEAKRLAEQYQFFHFQLAFPEVFAQGGFDVSLGNPPWEQTELKEIEWFAQRKPEISTAKTGAERKRMIDALLEEQPSLHNQFLEERRLHEGTSHFFSASGKYPLCGRGRINLFAVFAEGKRNLISSRGRVGCILPTGIATSDTTKYFFHDLLTQKSLRSLYDFHNREGLFPQVRPHEQFCLLTVAGNQNASNDRIEFAFGLANTGDLSQQERKFTLSPAEISHFNPNTNTCAIFRSRADVELTKVLYQAPVFLRDGPPEVNPWEIAFKQGLFNITSDSGLFRTAAELEERGFTLVGTTFIKGDESYLPVFDPKMAQQFNHRAAEISASGNQFRKISKDETTIDQLGDPTFSPLPLFWVAESETKKRMPHWSQKWLLGFKDVTGTTSTALGVFAVIPLQGVGNKFPLIFSQKPAGMVPLLLAVLNSFVTEFVLRLKFQGLSLNFFYVKQLPVLPPERFSEPAEWSVGRQSLNAWLLPRVLELTYTAWDLESFAQDCGWSGPPFRWDEERRFLLRCELDAAFFHLYLGPETEWRQQPAALTQAFPTPRAAVAYILDTFPIVKRKDEAKFNGDYRTKRVILEIYDALATAMQTDQAYQTRLNPAPASLAVAHLPRFDRERFNFKEAGDYILPFVASLLRHQGGECDVMILIRAYAMLLGDRKTLTTLTEARFGTEAGAWVKRFNQPVDASWFLPILRGLDNRDVIKLEERGEKDVFVRLLDASVPSNSTVETDVYLLLQVLDLNAMPVAAVAEQVKRISPKAIRTSLHEAKLVTA
jgi:hypothetical protein